MLLSVVCSRHCARQEGGGFTFISGLYDAVQLRRDQRLQDKTDFVATLPRLSVRDHFKALSGKFEAGLWTFGGRYSSSISFQVSWAWLILNDSGGMESWN